MATIKYTTVKTALEPIAGKYTGQSISNGTVYLDEIARKICRNHPVTDEPSLTLAARAIASIIKEEVAERLNYVTTGTLCAFAPAIAGSVPAMDSPLGEDNAFYVNITPLDPLANAIGAISPVRDRSDAATVSVDNIEDRATKARSTIIGTQEFVITGFNLSARSEGESIRLLNPDGTIASEVTVKNEDGCGQRIVAQLAETVESGTYVLQINTKGYATPDAEVESYTKKATVLDA